MSTDRVWLCRPVRTLTCSSRALITSDKSSLQALQIDLIPAVDRAATGRGSYGPAFVLVGTKCDLAEKRAISFEEASAFANILGIRYFETCVRLLSGGYGGREGSAHWFRSRSSAAQDIGVDEPFHCLAEELVQEVERCAASPPWRPQPRRAASPSMFARLLNAVGWTADESSRNASPPPPPFDAAAFATFRSGARIVSVFVDVCILLVFSFSLLFSLLSFFLVSLV